jgi:hypothetical protein
MDAPPPSADPPLLMPGPSSTDQHWELLNPRPVSVDLYGVWGPWLVGQAGTVLRFDGAHTTNAFSGPAEDDYHHVWASSDDDVWIAGRHGKGHVVMHGVHNAFTIDPTIGTRAVHALFGFAKNDVWIAADDGHLMHFDGATWTERFHTPDGKPLRAIWGSGAKDVWSAGDSGTLYHFDGTSFTPYTFDGAPSDARFYGIWGPSSSDVWAAFDSASSTKVVHFDGTRWSQEDAPLVGDCPGEGMQLTSEPESRGRGMWGVQNGTRLVIVASRGGSCRITLENDGTWRSPWQADIEEGADFADMWGDRLETFFAVGRGGRIGRIRGENPGVTTTPVFPGRHDQLTGVSIGEGGEIWAVGADSTASDDQLFRWSDLGWTPVVDVPKATFVTAVGVRSQSDVWIGMIDVLEHWNGATWDKEIPLETGSQVERITIGPDGDTWATGNAIWRLVSDSWVRVATPTSQHSTAVWSLSKNDVWFATNDWSTGGQVLHWDGKKITSAYSRPKSGGFWGVWASGPTNVYVSGNESMHFDGKTWARVPVAASHGVWGSDPQHVYFGTWGGTDAAQIVRWDGTRSEVAARHWAGLTPLEFGGSKEVGFAVGDQGLTFRLAKGAAPTK